VNIEGAQSARGDVTAGITTIVQNIAAAASRYLGDPRLIEWVAELTTRHTAHGLLQALLEHWAQHSDQSIVLLLDEVDALVGDTLISLLRQIRAGYAQRPGAFPQTLILCGVRDVRDYESIPQGRRSSPAARPSISRPNHCVWAVSAPRKPHCCISNTPRKPAKSSRTGFWRKCGN
jgi:hypothetical protein